MLLFPDGVIFHMQKPKECTDDLSQLDNNKVAQWYTINIQILKYHLQ